MNNYLHILRFNKQKIPSTLENLVQFTVPDSQIPRKTKFSGHFGLNTPIIGVNFQNLLVSNCLIIN